MIKGKIYEYLHKYLGEYLFGFDKSKLEVAILSGIFLHPKCFLGQIDLNDVNLRPDKINELLNAIRSPFVIKVGMVGKLRLEVIYIICNKCFFSTAYFHYYQNLFK